MVTVEFSEASAVGTFCYGVGAIAVSGASAVGARQGHRSVLVFTMCYGMYGHSSAMPPASPEAGPMTGQGDLQQDR